MKRARKILISGAFLIMAALQVGAQIPNSMFFMPGVPQSNRINPAIQPGCGLYLGMPVLSPLRLQIGLSSLAFDDVFTYNGDLDAYITAFHPDANAQKFLDKLQPLNSIMANVGISPISFGFRAGKSFISFDMMPRIETNIFYPKGLLELPHKGLEDEQTVTLDGLGVDVSAFIETSIGWSRRDFIVPNLDIGVRGKLLSGLANISTPTSELSLRSSADELVLNSDLELSINLPSVIPIPGDLSIGDIDTAWVDSFITSVEDAVNTYTQDPLSKIGTYAKDVFLYNYGFGVDLGINYKPIPQLKVSASLLDLGFIDWKNHVSGSANLDYAFQGFDINPFNIDSLSMELEEFQQGFLETALDSMSLSSGSIYRSRLHPKLYIGASFYPIEKIGIGILSRTDFLSNRIAQQFTASANMTTGRFLNLSLSYTYMKISPKNLGAGLSVNLGPFNMYVISDNIGSVALWPTQAQSLNLWFGMNLCFGYRVAKKAPAPKDMPLIL